MATPDQIRQNLLDYIAGRAPAPSWLASLNDDPATRQLYNFVNSSRTTLANGVSDPASALGTLNGYLGSIVNTAFPNSGVDYGLQTSGSPAPDRPLPTALPADPNRPGLYLDPRNTIPNYAGSDASGGAGVNPATGGPGSAPLTDAQKSAQAQINSTLANYGLSNLGGQLWNQFLTGVPIDQIYLNMRETPEYQQRFPGMKALDQQGQHISESQYIGMEQSYRQVLNAAGIPQSVLPDAPSTYGSWISGGVSPTEVKDRADLAAQAAVSAPAETRAELQRLYGISAGDLTAYWLAPDKTLPVLQQRFTAASLAGAADSTGYGGISQSQAENLAGLGITQSQATQGFGALASEQQLFNPLDQGENQIGSDQQIGAQFGNNAIAQQAIQARIARRKAAFAGGGGFAGNGQGLSGLGTTATG